MTRAALALAALVACGNGGTSPRTDTPATTAPGGHGTVSTRTFHSKALGVDKDYLVYLPAEYATKPELRWPVLYYLHGLTGNETNWTKHGKLDQIADRMGLQAIVVMPDGDDGFYTNSAAKAIDYDACMKDGAGLFAPVEAKWLAKTCVRHRAYETYVIEDLLGDVDAQLRTIASKDGRAIAGLSMGGFGALQLALRNSNKFAAAASHSGVDALLFAGPYPYDAKTAHEFSDVAHWGDNVGAIGPWVRGIFGDDLDNWRAHDPATLATTLVPGNVALYLDCGTEDEFHLDAEAQYLHDRLTALHIDHAYYLGPGRHDFAFWTARLPESLAFLRARVAKPRAATSR